MAGRRLGQHFLRSKGILERIAAAASAGTNVPIVEIGPGKGALTQYLPARASRVIAIEVDPVLVHYLTGKFRDEPKLTVVHKDVLHADLAAWGRVAVCGNLPYYITSPIVEKVLALGPLLVRAVFLVQKEVAQRIAAVAGTRDYGYLSVQTRVHAEPKILFDVPPGAFSPPPKVESSVVQLAPHAQPLVEDVPAFLEFASAAFRQKRKTLRNNLAAVYGKDALDTLPEAGKRAEQLSPQELIEIHQRILKFR